MPVSAKFISSYFLCTSAISPFWKMEVTHLSKAHEQNTQCLLSEHRRQTRNSSWTASPKEGTGWGFRKATLLHQRWFNWKQEKVSEDMNSDKNFRPCAWLDESAKEAVQQFLTQILENITGRTTGKGKAEQSAGADVRSWEAGDQYSVCQVPLLNIVQTGMASQTYRLLQGKTGSNARGSFEFRAQDSFAVVNISSPSPVSKIGDWM